MLSVIPKKVASCAPKRLKGGSKLLGEQVDDACEQETDDDERLDLCQI